MVLKDPHQQKSLKSGTSSHLAEFEVTYKPKNANNANREKSIEDAEASPVDNLRCPR